MPISQNGQTHSNSSSAICVFDHFVGLALKGLNSAVLNVFSEAPNDSIP